MKKILFSLLFILGISLSGVAQTYSYGLKGGVNYSMGGVAQGERSGVIDRNNDGVPNEPNKWNGIAEASGQMGFQFGAFGQVNFGKFFVRPEVVYTSIERLYDWPKYPTEFHTPIKGSEHSVQKLDIPLLAGYNVWGPIDIYAGPVYSSIMNTEIMSGDQGEGLNLVVQNSPINAQVGVKAEFGRFGLDLRYEHSLSSVETQYDIDLKESEYGVNKFHSTDSRIDLVKVNVTFKIGGSDMKNRRRRGGNCY
ncbi:MAG TPA: hypothetical protein ENO10_06190 [Salinimicrobium catena]|uniref:Outer membrane protein beta-barrel domain-containing protein n=1 Tax=Salinimicrobium catena TaxID=390640 RepID=A0A7C2R4D5_9FLAO|nr:hypothetical protein [Salinimicrobium catena]